jgi:hypothetical protein
VLVESALRRVEMVELASVVEMDLEYLRMVSNPD